MGYPTIDMQTEFFKKTLATHLSSDGLGLAFGPTYLNDAGSSISHDKEPSTNVQTKVPSLSTNSSNIDIDGRDQDAHGGDAHGVVPGVSAEESCGRLSPEKERQLRELYERLDLDHDGTLDIRDLTETLQTVVPHIPPMYAPQLLEKMAVDCEKVTFPDFVRYVTHKEEKLAAMFQDLDHDQDGRIDGQDFRRFSDKLGIVLSDHHADQIVHQIRVDHTTDSIDLPAFQDYMRLLPYSYNDPKDIFRFWGHKGIDIGEDSSVPNDFSKEELASGAWKRHLVAGGAAGAVSRTFTAPFDRLKVYLQVNANRSNNLGIIQTVKLLFNEGGAKSFWRGNGVNIAKIAPESALKFAVYEHMKHLIVSHKNHSGEIEIYERFLAGSTAGAVSQTAIYPMEVLKTRLALRRSGQLDNGLVGFARKLYQREGLRCFYRGYVPNLLGIIPYAGIDLAVYETVKNWYIQENPHVKQPGILALLACGTISSTCGQLASYPLSLVRTRLQARTWAVNQPQPTTMLGQFRYILKNEGVTGLYRGIAPNFMKVIPAVSMSYVVYEHVNRYLSANH